MTAKRARRPPGRRSAAAQAEHRRRRKAALQGWETRRRKERAKVRAARKRVKAARHGERARKATTRKLTPAQIERRRREARRIAQKVRRAKKAPRVDQRPRRSTRSRSSRAPEGHAKASRPKLRQLTFQSGKENAHGAADPFAAQISVEFDMPAGFRPTRELVNEAIRYRIDHGHDAPHVTTKILRWRNPGRRRAEDRSWRQGNQPDAWTTLGNVIRAALG